MDKYTYQLLAISTLSEPAKFDGISLYEELQQRDGLNGRNSVFMSPSHLKFCTTHSCTKPQYTVQIIKDLNILKNIFSKSPHYCLPACFVLVYIEYALVNMQSENIDCTFLVQKMY